MVRLAIWGCGHGTLDRVYESLVAINASAAPAGRVDALVCCGDFQAARNEHDLMCMECPQKYKSMQDFWKYYSGAAKAPVLTIFIGGNHEASNHCQELPYGGWVAPNIYYLGTSGCVRLGGLRIAGLSGIYKRYNYEQGYYEIAPYDDSASRSVYHVREFDVWRLRHLGLPVLASPGSSTADAASTDHPLAGGAGVAATGVGGSSAAASALGQQPQQRPDVFLSHDWPEGIYAHGDVQALLRKKAHFREDIASGQLGNPETAKHLLPGLRPRFWFSAHLHIKFAAVVRHGTDSTSGAAGSSSSRSSGAVVGSAGSGFSAVGAAAPAAAVADDASGSSAAETTRFLALDKCLPGRHYLQIVDISPPSQAEAGVRSDESAASSSSGPASGSAAASSGTDEPLQLEFDVEWLTIVRKTHTLLPTGRRYPPLPLPSSITAEDVAETWRLLQAWLRSAANPSSTGAGDAAAAAAVATGSDATSEAADTAASGAAADGDVSAPSSSSLRIPHNFRATVPAYAPAYPGAEIATARVVAMPHRVGNPQTDELLAALGLRHRITTPWAAGQVQVPEGASAAGAFSTGASAMGGTGAGAGPFAGGRGGGRGGMAGGFGGRLVPSQVMHSSSSAFAPGTGSATGPGGGAGGNSWNSWQAGGHAASYGPGYGMSPHMSMPPHMHMQMHTGMPPHMHGFTGPAGFAGPAGSDPYHYQRGAGAGGSAAGPGAMHQQQQQYRSFDRSTHGGPPPAKRPSLASSLPAPSGAKLGAGVFGAAGAGPSGSAAAAADGYADADADGDADADAALSFAAAVPGADGSLTFSRGGASEVAVERPFQLGVGDEGTVASSDGGAAPAAKAAHDPSEIGLDDI